MFFAQESKSVVLPHSPVVLTSMFDNLFRLARGTTYLLRSVTFMFFFVFVFQVTSHIQKAKAFPCEETLILNMIINNE